LLRLSPLLAALAPLGAASAAWAAPPPASGLAPPGPVEDHDSATDQGRRVVTVPDLRPQPVHEDRAASVVTRREMQERLPRSAPDALRFEPGVYVQQTAHAQASPYVRGLTGQQTVLLFDGIRLNTSTFRQGPNQYFFTIDSRTIARLEVLRGAASTRYGSDAMGGALLTTPVDPTFGRRWQVHPRAIWASRTADGELGGRAQMDVSWNDRAGLVGGVGYRDVGLLRTAGPVIAPATGEPHREPRFAPDGRTQLGTGFREFTADARAVVRAGPRWRLTAAYYDYRQKDAPRTDQCPPAEAPDTTCMTYLDQFRTLAYLAADLRRGPDLAERLRVTASYQNQHERRRLFRASGVPDSDGGTENNGADDVHTFGAALQVSTRRWTLGPSVMVGIDYGTDAYVDRVESVGWILFTDTAAPVLVPLSRGQYLDQSHYLTSGVWAEPQLRLWDRVTLRVGGRGALVHAQAPPDTESGSAAIDRTFGAGVGNAGLAVVTWPWLTVHANYDQGFRAPNLDDLTSRQQTGPGYLFENPTLRPERAHAFEQGVKIRSKVLELGAFAFQSLIDDAIAKAARTVEECPEDQNAMNGCTGSRSRFQLVNLAGRASVLGIDGGMRVFLPLGFLLGGTVAYAVGAGPNPSDPPDPRPDDFPRRVPLSRVPPLNGTAEASWRHASGIWIGAALRWATEQDRLAPADQADVRIPAGGTPGFAVVDLRAGYRFDPHLLVGIVVENVGDAAYRYHGSSVNGATRSLNMVLEAGF
jgi:iron complex outermembrane receptor protein/hemoglobin/transferrin/lactoferrin receptor protein